jgi:hypothetical protein
VTANVTFKLECTGDGGTTSATATATVMAQSESRGGGGVLGWLVLAALGVARCVPRRRGALQPA